MKKHLERSDDGLLKNWFDRLKTLIETNGVSPANIYNIDDTSFQIGEGNRPIWVFALNGSPHVPEVPRSRPWCEWITAIDCVAADGWKSEPCLVIQGDHYLDEWFQEEGYSDQAVFHFTSSGRVTPNAALEWLQEFHEQIKDRVEEGQSRILLHRGESHFLSFNFLKSCDEHSIIPFCFPAKMGHLVQPFDGKPFEPYKRWWAPQLRTLKR